MRGLLAIALVLCFLPGTAAAQQSVTYGWEDGKTVLGLYGAGTPPIIATNVTNPVHSGLSSLQLQDNEPSGTPQAYLAWVTGLVDGDVVTASFWRYDTTPPGAPSCRIWAHWDDNECDVMGYNTSASGNSDYGPGTGWDQTSYTWTVSGGHKGLVVECRTYTNPGDTVWLDDLTVTAPEGTVIVVPSRGPLQVDLSITDLVAECSGDTTRFYATVSTGACGSATQVFEAAVDYVVDFFINDWYLGMAVGWAQWVWEGTCPGQPYPDCTYGACPVMWAWDPEQMLFYPVYPDCVARGDLVRCACQYAYPLSFVYVGPRPLTEGKQWQLRAVIDAANTVGEWNETNNEFSTPSGPTATKPATWGAVKAMYR